MSDGNEGGGLLGGLLLGAGFAGMILLPFYIGYRFGAHVLAVLAAGVMTLYALFSPALVELARDTSCTGLTCFSNSAGPLILELDKIGWWWLAGAMWVMAGLMYLAHAVRARAAQPGVQ